MTKEQLDSVLAIIDGYDARMKLAREYFDRRKPVPEKHKQYLAPLEDEDVVKAFEALRPLAARVRELERQRDKLLGMYCNEMVCSWCWLDEVCPHFDETIVRRNPNSEGCRETLRKWLEHAAKEAGE